MCSITWVLCWHPLLSISTSSGTANGAEPSKPPSEISSTPSPFRLFRTLPSLTGGRRCASTPTRRDLTSPGKSTSPANSTTPATPTAGSWPARRCNPSSSPPPAGGCRSTLGTGPTSCSRPVTFRFRNFVEQFVGSITSLSRPSSAPSCRTLGSVTAGPSAPGCALTRSPGPLTPGSRRRAGRAEEGTT
ncbi:unnamed protein product [Linum tenue]|uniref:Secreted protein n=1 Tax=Linum tenue TaxID=586396 RepID=A0AAV0IW42_9ROSI|nr:unnamed protein product [Linum tenue]